MFAPFYEDQLQRAIHRMKPGKPEQKADTENSEVANTLPTELGDQQESILPLIALAARLPFDRQRGLADLEAELTKAMEARAATLDAVLAKLVEARQTANILEQQYMREILEVGHSVEFKHPTFQEFLMKLALEGKLSELVEPGRQKVGEETTKKEGSN